MLIRNWPNTPNSCSFCCYWSSFIRDTLYGSSSPLIARQALHAYQVTFFHPITKKKVCYIAPIPDDFDVFYTEKR